MAEEIGYPTPCAAHAGSFGRRAVTRRRRNRLVRPVVGSCRVLPLDTRSVPAMMSKV